MPSLLFATVFFSLLAFNFLNDTYSQSPFFALLELSQYSSVHCARTEDINIRVLSCCSLQANQSALSLRSSTAWVTLTVLPPAGTATAAAGVPGSYAFNVSATGGAAASSALQQAISASGPITLTIGTIVVCLSVPHALMYQLTLPLHNQSIN